ncbi:MAG: DUF1294 domain-containing protein [Planctomycetota bacterium]
MIPTLLVLLVANGVALGLFAYDKRLAGRGKPRISENRLLQWSLLGPVGASAGIFWIRHKSRKSSFLIRYAIVMLISVSLHIAAGYFFLPKLL